MHGTHKLVKTHDLIGARACTGGLRGKNQHRFIWGLGRPPEDGALKVSPEDEKGSSR